MTARCAEVVRLLGPLFDGALPPDDREWVEEHVRGCASCTDRLALIAAQSAALSEVLTSRASQADFAGFSRGVLARIQREPRPSWRPALRVWSEEMWTAHRAVFTAAAGAGLAACVALAAVFMPKAREPDAQRFAEASAPQLDQIDFGTHDGAVLQLPRGTTVIWVSDDKGVQE